MRKKTLISMLLLIVFVFSSCSSTIADLANSDANTNTSSAQTDATTLTPGASAKKLTYLAVKEANGIDEAAVAFGIDLLKAAQEDGKNCMISPLSILIALGMTANGADGETLKQMEEVLFGGKSIEEFNEYYKALLNRIANPVYGVLSLANSTWYRDEQSLKMNENFLALVKENFESEVKPADFNDPDTVNSINNWVKEKTNGHIDKIINEIPKDTVIYLLNAVYFEQKWMEQYLESQNKADKFHTPDGAVDATYMAGGESFYIQDDDVQGFIKPYEGNELSFVALLPKEGMTAEAYLSQLTGKKMLDLLKNKQKKSIMVYLPKFKTEFEASLVDPLKSLGITDAFEQDKANFKKMATATDGNLFVADVFHKTFIEVNEAGTKAAAVTKVEIRNDSINMYETTLTFDRPFLYMIIDNKTNLPLFIGIMNNPSK